MWRNTRRRASTGAVLGDWGGWGGGGGLGQFKEVKSLLISSNRVKSLGSLWEVSGHLSSLCHTHKCWSTHDDFGNDPTLLNKLRVGIQLAHLKTRTPFQHCHFKNTAPISPPPPRAIKDVHLSVGLTANPENAPRSASFSKDDAIKMLLSTCDSRTTTTTSGCVRTLEPRRLFHKHHPIWGQAQLPAEEPSCV